METTLHGCTGCQNDRVLVDKITYRFSDPHPGDVVVFRGPDGWTSEFTAEEPGNVVVRALQGLGSLIGLAPPDEKDFIKRVIAVGGQTVQCCDSRNRVTVDGKPLDEPYIYFPPKRGTARQDRSGRSRCPAGELWMMGDSRNNSADSRVPGHGPVPISNVIGSARFIVLPFSRLGGIPSPDPQATTRRAGRGATAPGSRSAWSGSSRSSCCAVATGSWASSSRGAGREPGSPPPNARGPAVVPRVRASLLPAELRPGRAVVRRSAGNWTLQSTLQRHGLGPVAGVDEAGRGACAGPLVVAACVLRPGDARRLEGLTDSKLLTAAAREEYFALITRWAADRCVVVIPADEVDRRGVHVANIEGMRRAVAGLASTPGYVLTDGFPVRGFG